MAENYVNIQFKDTNENLVTKETFDKYNVAKQTIKSTVNEYEFTNGANNDNKLNKFILGKSTLNEDDLYKASILEAKGTQVKLYTTLLGDGEVQPAANNQGFLDLGTTSAKLGCVGSSINIEPSKINMVGIASTSGCPSPTNDTSIANKKYVDNNTYKTTTVDLVWAAGMTTGDDQKNTYTVEELIGDSSKQQVEVIGLTGTYVTTILPGKITIQTPNPNSSDLPTTPTMFKLKITDIVSEPNWVDFYSATRFKVTLNGATASPWEKGSLYFSRDTYTWSAWDGTTAINATTKGIDNQYHIYMRGYNSGLRCYYSGSESWHHPFKFGVSSAIYSKGYLAHLVDYTADVNTIKTYNIYAFAGLFSQCDNLITAPSLKGIDAGSNSSYGFIYLFENCTKLETLPKIYASNPNNTTSFGYNQLTNMFIGCSKLKLYDANYSSISNLKPYKIYANTTSTSTAVDFSYDPNLPVYNNNDVSQGDAKAFKTYYTPNTIID